MYLSQLTLDPQQPQARRDLANRYDLHATLAWAFADQPDPRPLWRLELVRASEPPTLLVQSSTPPDWARLTARHRGYLRDARSKPLALTEQLAADQRLRFRLEANPTVTRDGKRHGLLHEDDQLAWLARQGERGGFTIETAIVTRAERLTLRKHAAARHITLYAVLLDGYLRVADPALLTNTLAHGIGHGKALGLGLLSLGAG